MKRLTAATIPVCFLAFTFLSRAQPGSLDITFNPGSGASGGYGNATITGLALQPDGKVVLIGDFAKFNGTARDGIARLSADGSLDTSLDPGDAVNLYSQTLSVLSLQTNGALIVGGFFSAMDNVSRNSIAQLRPDGSLDANFNLV